MACDRCRTTAKFQIVSGFGIEGLGSRAYRGLGLRAYRGTGVGIWGKGLARVGFIV